MLSFELKDKVFQYIDSMITLEELEDWLVPQLPTLLKRVNTADEQVIATVELGLAEITAKIRTEEEFRKLLKQTLGEQNSIWAVYPSAIQETESSTSSQTSRHSFSQAEFAFVIGF